MRKLLYVEDEFLNPSLCHPFINLHGDNKEETFLEAVTHSDSNESLTYSPDIPEPDGDYGAIYLGGDVSPVDIKLTNDELFSSVIANVTKVCKSFDSNIQLDYCGVIRWPTGTFMKPHYDKSDMYSPNTLAAFLYLNDDYIGGEQLKRALIEREQDEVLDDLGQSVSKLGAMGISAACPCCCPCPPCLPLSPACSNIAVLSTHSELGRPLDPHGVEGAGVDPGRP